MTKVQSNFYPTLYPYHIVKKEIFVYLTDYEFNSPTEQPSCNKKIHKKEFFPTPWNNYSMPRFREREF